MSLSERMKMKMKRNSNIRVVVGINIFFAVIGVVILHISSLFWMGSHEEMNNMVHDSYWSFFGYRFLFNLIINAAYLCFLGVLNWFLANIFQTDFSIAKIIFIDLVLFSICSIVFVVLQLSSAKI